jgi:hypothetical protein
MTNRMKLSIACAALAAVLTATSSRALEPGQKIAATLIGVATQKSKGVYGPVGDRSSSGGDVAEGETARAFVAYGVLDDMTFALKDTSAHACGSIPSGERTIDYAASLAKDAAFIWTAEMRALPSPIGKVALEVKWEKWSRVGTGALTQVTGDTRRIEMFEGNRTILDVLSFDPPFTDFSYSNLQIAVEAKIVEDPALAAEKLAYDLWVEHVDAKGQTTRRHIEAVGSQGEAVTVRSEPLRFPVPNVRFADGTGFDAILELTGYLRGRIQTDGSVRIDLQAGRWTGVTRAGEPRRGGIGDGGKKVVTMNPGETVRLTLPVPTGGTGIYLSTDAKGNVPTPVRPDNLFTINNKTYYAGSQDSLILTVNRVR